MLGIEKRVTRQLHELQPCRWMCPSCTLRYGVPEKNGWIDIKLCDPCELKRLDKLREPTRKRRQDYE
jgi:hypothetical protein